MREFKMKKRAYLILSFFVLALSYGCDASKKLKATTNSAGSEMAEEEKKGPVMTFDEKMVDFGTVKKGEKRTHIYKFTNTGDEDLVIELVTACDCTTLDYSTEPVKPGGRGEIKAVFDSSEKEAEEIIDIDIILKNIDPETGYPMIERVQYRFDIQN